jgi:hypothetical protein
LILDPNHGKQTIAWYYPIAVRPRADTKEQHMFVPSINVDFDKLRGEEEVPEQTPVRKARATPKSRAAAKPVRGDSAKKD